jgi:CelD/BcsL family acetyltransferase involved in cellulose biosynthesis
VSGERAVPVRHATSDQAEPLDPHSREDRRLELLPISDPRWTSFVCDHRDASPFHHPDWATLIGDTYGYRPFTFAVVDAAGGITAGAPAIDVRGIGRKHRWISLPFTDHCEPLANDPDDVGWLVERLADLRETELAPPIEIRAGLDRGAAIRRPVGLLHTLRLHADSAEVFRSFKKSQVQQSIVKAEKEGVAVRFADSWETAADTFYRLHVASRRRLGVPVQPRRYFRLFWERLVEPGLAFILVGYAGDRPAAAAVFLAWNETVIYKYSASDSSLWKLRPNNLVLWTAIRWACENGYRSFDFGRTDLDNEGLRAFKRGWGTTEHELVYSSIGGPSVEPAGGGAASIARPVIQRMPEWFCRAVGEIAYRYAS